MPTTKRRFEPSVIQRLLATPYRFQFFQAIRIIELWFKQRGVSSEQVLSNHIRFANRVSLGYPPGEIESLTVYPSEPGAAPVDAELALLSEAFQHLSLTPTFMGFLGGNGTLPNHYTERVAAHQALEKDEGPRAFLDIFSNRAVALFYRAWRKYRLELHYDQANGKDGFLPLLMSLAGLGQGSLHDRLRNDGEGVLDESIGRLAAAVRQRPTSAALLQRVLSEYFAVPIALEQFVGMWYHVPREHQTQLGSTNAVLGTTAMVGARVWQRDLRVRLRIGPLARADFEQFLPRAKAALALQKILTLFTGVCLEYEVQLILRASDISQARLDDGGSGGRLGWDLFLTSKPELKDRMDVCYDIHAVAADF
jgi:type VI secretion system protein ImpH